MGGEDLIKFLQVFFNKCLDEGKIPEDLKNKEWYCCLKETIAATSKTIAQFYNIYVQAVDKNNNQPPSK